MIYYLDTNIIVYLLNKRNKVIEEKMRSVSRKSIMIPSMVVGEYFTGIHKKNNKEKEIDAIRFFSNFEVAPFDADASMVYSKIRAKMEKNGNVIGSNDLIIAATVMSRGGILVTHNIKEFERVEGLQIEDWSIEE